MAQLLIFVQNGVSWAFCPTAVRLPTSKGGKIPNNPFSRKLSNRQANLAPIPIHIQDAELLAFIQREDFFWISIIAITKF